MREVSELIPYARNSRTHSEAQVAQIAASIREFGWTVPVLVDGSNGIIAGHGRVMAARLLKMKSVPCIELSHLTETQKRAYVIADNKLALNAGWDEDLLRLDLAEIHDDGFDLALTGFSDAELRELSVSVDEAELPELSDSDRAPFQQMTFTMHDDQVEAVRRALEIAKEMGEFEGPNENSNGNALARICETFVTDCGVQDD